MSGILHFLPPPPPPQSPFRVVKSIRLRAKIAAYLDRIGRLLWLAFLYIWCFLNKISQDWPPP